MSCKGAKVPKGIRPGAMVSRKRQFADIELVKLEARGTVNETTDNASPSLVTGEGVITGWLTIEKSGLELEDL